MSERIQRQIDRLLDEAEAAFAQREWLPLRDCAQDILKLDPENADARTFLCAAEAGLAPAQPVVPPQSPAAPPQALHPTSFAGGRYQVRRFLGEGGKKRVYLAHDTLLDRDVAFALIKTDGLDEEGRERITREAQAMGRLGTHPHIVSVYDMGTIEPSHDRQGVVPSPVTQQPYLVTEFMPGGDVEGLLEKADGRRLPIEVAIDIARQVCQGLEFAHAHGLVHRDLKPGNVWLAGPVQSPESNVQSPTTAHPGPRTQDSGLVAKIGDFGLAVVLDRSRLTQAGMMVGTVAYMPPEQAMGGEVTTCADLYSLGCMLYQMVCGRPPFAGDDSVAIIGQHLNTPPVSPAWHRHDCPPGLENLILRLLAKDPSDRPPGAHEVLADLEAIDLATGPPAGTRGGDDPLGGLASGAFVGRAQELAQGRSAVDAALSGRSGLLLIAGDRGIGKTRLAEEIATYASLRGATALWGRTHEAGGAPAYWPWIQALRSYLRNKEPARLRSELGSAGPDVAKVVSELRERLPDLPPASPGDPAQERFRLFDAVTTFLRNASASQPLVLVLENLHWADQPSLMLLQFLVQEAVDARLLVLGTYRDTELGRRHPLSQFLADVVQERRVQRLTLRGLDREETGRMMEALTGTAPAAGLLNRVHQATEGVPLFVEEMVRLLAQEGRLHHGSGEAVGLAIPESLREVVGRRLDRLSEEANEVLTLAAVAGREFDLALIKELTDKDEDKLLELLEGAVGARILEEAPSHVAQGSPEPGRRTPSPVVGRYRFSHALTPETLLGELSTARRVRLHGRVGEALERIYGPGTERHAAELAYHFGQAAALTHATEKAVRYAVLAAQAAEAGYAYEEAIRHYEGAIGLIEDVGQPLGQDMVALRRGLATAQRGVYRMVDAFRNFRGAMNLARERGDGQTAAELALELGHTGFVRPPLLVQLLSEGLDVAPDPESETVARLHALVAEPMLMLGRVDEAGDHQRRGEDLAQRHGYVQGRLSAAYTAFQAAAWNLEMERLPQLEAQLEEAEAAAGRHATGVWTRVRAEWPLTCGDLDGARERSQRLLQYATRVRNPYDIVVALLALATADYLQGDLTGCERHTERATEVAKGEPDLRIEWHRSRLALIRGDLQQARSHLAATVAINQRINRAPALTRYIAPMAELEQRLGDRPAADEAYRQAVHGLNATRAYELSRLSESASVGLLAAARGDHEVMERCEGVLSRHPDLLANAVGTAPDTTCVRRVLGAIAAVRGRWNEAIDHLERGFAFCRGKELPVELAHCRLALADALMRRNPATGQALEAPPDDPAVRRRASALVDQALADFQRMGMPLYAQDALARRAIIGA